MQERLRIMQMNEANRINDNRTIKVEIEQAEKEEYVSENANDKLNEGPSTGDTSQSSLNQMMSKVNYQFFSLSNNFIDICLNRNLCFCPM